MKFLLSLLVCCCIAAFAQAQQLRCSNSIFINGDLEIGTPTAGDQDIGNALGFSRAWAPNSWADYYTGTTGPFTPPSPNTGNYAACWIANQASGGTTYREGFQAELGFTLPKNSGTYNLTFDAACLSGWGNSEIAIYALHNPSGGDAPNPPTGAFTPSNIALFGGVNIDIIGTIPVSGTSCSNTKTNYLFTINTNAINFPIGGMTHVFITHSDNAAINGALFMAFDNFCIPTYPNNDFCPASWVVNGDIENGTPTLSDQDIHLATGFDRIWNGSGLSYADYYPFNYAPAGFPTPSPASGDYAASWISNHPDGGSTTYREGFRTELVSPIPANTGNYELNFDMACLHGFGIAEVAVYGINNPTGNYSLNPTGPFTPSNIDLFGASNTVLLGTISVTNSTCTSTKTNQSIIFNSAGAGFPTQMTHFFVTHSDNMGVSGSHFMAFDDFCLRSTQVEPPTPCPSITGSSASCANQAGYNYTINTSNVSGSVVLSSSCGTFSPSVITLTGATSYTVTFTPNGSCGNNITVSYLLGDADGADCGQGTLNTILPDCNPPCSCDEDFYQSVELLFDYYEECPNDYLIPRDLSDDCDRVEWTFDGNVVGYTSGNDPFIFPHLNQPVEVCMTVIRTTPSGETCEHRVCRFIEPELYCEPDQDFTFGRLQVSPNPATTQVMVSWEGRDLPDNLSIRVFNSSGVAVKLVNNINSFDSNTRLDIADLPIGLYYIQVQGEGYNPAPLKFIKK